MLINQVYTPGNLREALWLLDLYNIFGFKVLIVNSSKLIGRLLCAVVLGAMINSQALAHDLVERTTTPDFLVGKHHKEIANKEDIELYVLFQKSKGKSVSVVRNFGVKLSNLDLSNIYLGQADLYKANLQNSTLDMSDLSEAYLAYANLSHASIRGANLKWAILSNAKINNAVLKLSNLDYSSMVGTALINSDLH
jgi:uncharacterized protein YjbI with pentapeptide repeats